MTLEEVNARIATLEQKIAEKKAMDARYNRPASTFDYIISGDRSGLDRIAQQMMAEELNRQNKAIENVARQDEYVKNRNKAATTYKYAEQALDAANKSGDNVEIAKAERDLELAEEDFNYWNNKTDNKLDITPKQPEQTTKPTNDNEPKMNLESQIEQYKAITGGKNSNEYSAILDEIKSNPNYGQSKELQAQYERINKLYKNRLVWEADEAFMKNWDGKQPYDTKKFKLVFKNGKPSLERNK
jgi:hypothetical protein